MSFKKKGYLYLRKWGPLSVALITFVIFIQYALKNIDEIPPVQWGMELVLVLFMSSLLIVLSICFVALAWHLMLKDFLIHPRIAQVQSIVLVSQFGKYLPGNIGHHIGRVLMAKDIGVPVPITLNTILVETLWSVAIGAGLATFSLIMFIDEKVLGISYQINNSDLIIVSVTLLLFPWLIVGGINRFFPSLARVLSKDGKIPVPKPKTAFFVSLLFLTCFVIIGVILKLQLVWIFGVAEGTVFQLTCLFSIAWIAGYLVPGAPGGLGVREGIMVLLLSPIIGSGTAIGLAVLFRVTTTLGDGMAFIIGLFLRRYSSRFIHVQSVDCE